MTAGTGQLVIGGALAAAIVLWFVDRDRAEASADTRADNAGKRATEASDRAAAASQAAAVAADRAGAARAVNAAAETEVARLRAESDALARSMADLDGSIAPLNPHGPAAERMRRFDPIFARFGRGIPVPFLRALAQAESGMNPDDPKGLINVVAVALRHYNQHHPEAPITAAQLRDPIANVTVAVHVLRTIIASYARNHPGVVNLREDWSNPHFAGLLISGWNAGYSEASGVGRVVRHLLARGVTDITVDRVFAAAPAAGAAATLANPANLAFARKVTAAYVHEARS